MAEIIPVMLRAAGYECGAVSEHKAILQTVKRVRKHDLIVCQVAVLEREEELLTWVLGIGRDIPVLATAVRSWPEIPEVIQERCSFLRVPFGRDMLLHTVRETLNDHTARVFFPEIAMITD